MKYIFLIYIFLITFSTCFEHQEYFIIPASKISSKDSGLLVREKIPKYNTTGYLATIPNPIGHFFIFYSEQDSKKRECNGRQKTSVQARNHHCKFATNGGPFSYEAPTCLGNIVSNGTIITKSSSSSENFGLDKHGNFILGKLSESQVSSLSFTNLVTGFGWLLQNKTIIPNQGGEIAPRTAIGVDENGKLLIFEADGIEKDYKGLTLHQEAVWFKELGAVWAINLDGGGSSTTYYNGQVINFPTCTDIDYKCERAVTTITCII